MTTTSQKPSVVDSRSLLLPYSIGLIIAMAIVQIVIAATGGEVTIVAGGLTAIVGLGILMWLWRNRRDLRHVRFGVVIAHVLAFVTVTMSYNIHAVVRAIQLGFGEDPAASIGDTLLGSSWFGATLVMSSLWGLGLLIHLVGAVLGRGWED